MARKNDADLVMDYLTSNGVPEVDEDLIDDNGWPITENAEDDDVQD